MLQQGTNLMFVVRTLVLHSQALKCLLQDYMTSLRETTPILGESVRYQLHE